MTIILGLFFILLSLLFYRIKPKIKSRNISSAVKNHEIFRRRLWKNHKELYSLNYPNPLEMQEYSNVVNSR